VTTENPDRLTKSELEALFADYSSELRAFLRGILRDSDLAAEAHQMTFVRTIERGFTARRETFKGWLFQVAFNEARGIRRRRKREANFTREMARRTKDDAISPEEMLIRQESIERLRDRIGQLPPTQQEILNLKIEQELTFQKISEQLDLPLGTVLTRMRAAMKTLTKQLGD